MIKFILESIFLNGLSYTRWKGWIKYLLEPSNSDYVSKWEVIKCRAAGHKCGVIWYNSNALEPDMHCRNCGDNLG